MSADSFSTVFTTHNALEAEFVRLALQESDIRCEVENAHQAALTGVLEIKVNVLAEDEARAREILGELDARRSSTPTLIVVAFDYVSGASELQLALRKLEQSSLVDIVDSAVIEHQFGNPTIKQHYHLARDGGMVGGLCGLILGAMVASPVLGLAAGAAAGAAMGGLTDIGIDDDFLEEVGRQIAPCSSALAILVRRADPDKVLAELKKFKGTVLKTTLSEEDEDRIREALAKSQPKSS